MATQELHRGRLVDHIQLVVKDLGASRRQAGSREIVERAHRAALAAGGRDNGAPGERHYHPGYYACYVLDPDGNNIEAVYHGPAERSAPSVVLTAR
jgi:hypothetical protein